MNGDSSATSAAARRRSSEVVAARSGDTLTTPQLGNIPGWSRHDPGEITAITAILIDLHLIPAIFRGLNRLQSSSVAYHYWHLTVIPSLRDNHIVIDHQLLRELITFVTLQKHYFITTCHSFSCFIIHLSTFILTSYELMMFAQENTSAHASPIALLEEGLTSPLQLDHLKLRCLTTEMTVADPGTLAGHPQLTTSGQHATLCRPLAMAAL